MQTSRYLVFKEIQSYFKCEKAVKKTDSSWLKKREIYAFQKYEITV